MTFGLCIFTYYKILGLCDTVFPQYFFIYAFDKYKTYSEYLFHLHQNFDITLHYVG